MARLNLIATALALLVSGAGFSCPAAAEVTTLEIADRQSYGTFSAGEFMLLEGRVAGELKPTEAIPDLDKASRNARGRVGYAAKISLILPANPSNGNGVLLVEIPNRGRVYAQALYNSPRDEPFESGTLEVGTGLPSGSRLQCRRGALGVGARGRVAVLHR
jgi:hypothetical protein